MCSTGTCGQRWGCVPNHPQPSSPLMQIFCWLIKHQSPVSAAYMTDHRVRAVRLMCAPHILIMNSGTIWASHSGLVRQELRGSPIHDQLIGKPVLSQGPIFTQCLSTETHSLPDAFRRKKLNINSQQRRNLLNDRASPQRREEILLLKIIYSTISKQINKNKI